MTGRISLRADAKAISEAFSLKDSFVTKPRYNIPPGTPIPTVVGPLPRIRFFEWGLIPRWSKNPFEQSGLFNLPVDKLFKNGGFKRLFQRQRCIVIVDGFYIWKLIGMRKQPYFVSRTDEKPFGLCALWESWSANAGFTLETAAIITRDAGDDAQSGTPKFPLIIAPADQALWLQKQPLQEKNLNEVVAGSGRVPLQVRPVSSLVNDPANDTPMCVQGLTETAI